MGTGHAEVQMDLIIAIVALVLVGLLIVGVFHGPSHRDARPRHRPASTTAPTPPSDPVPSGEAAMVPPVVVPPEAPLSEVPGEPPAYVLPPPRRRRHVPRRPVNGPRGRHS
jgi:hypothetical protein